LAWLILFFSVLSSLLTPGLTWHNHVFSDEQSIHHEDMAVSLVVAMLVLSVDDVNSRFVVSAYRLMTANAIGIVAILAIIWVKFRHLLTPLMS